MKKPKISILLPAYKSEKLLEKVFFCSMINWSLPVEQREVIIYDNGGNGNIRDDVMFTNKYIKILGDGKNIGLNQALNKCAEAATGDWFYLPHTDIYLLPGWDTALLEATKNHKPDTMLLCSRSVENTKGHTDFHIIKNYGREWHELKEEKLLEDFALYSDHTIVSGYRMPFFLHRGLWNRMGGVDNAYFSYCTDDDLVQTAYNVGVRQFWMVYNSLIYHLQGKSNQQQSVDRDSNKPYEYFINKWKERGYTDACHPGQWHPKLIPNYAKIR